MKSLIAALTLSLSAFSSLAAPASDESIRTLFTVMKAESLLDSIYGSIEPAMRQAMNQSLAGKPLTDAQKRVMERMPQRLSEVLRQELSWAKMEPIQLAIYRETFEQSEIDGLIEFYRSPIGQAFVNKMPIATQKAMVSMQSHMQQVMPRIQAAVADLLAEVQAAK